MAFTPVNDGDLAVAVQLQQVIDSLSGVAGAGQAIELTALGSTAKPALTLQNIGSTGWGLHVYSSAGADLLNVRNASTSIDNGTLFIDHTNNRVGVNNTSPAVALDVTGSASISGGLVVSGSFSLGSGITLANASFTGQALFAAGSVGAPSIAKTGDTDTGLNLLSTANVVQLVSGGVSAIAANIDSTTAMVRIDRDGQVDASLLSMTQSNASGGVASAWPALDVIRYTSGGGGAIRGAAHGSAGAGGSIIGGEFAADAGTSWDPTNGLIIGMKSDANAYRANAKCYGANIFAWAISAAATAATLTGIEVDVGGRVGSTVSVRYGIQVVSPDLAVVQASGEDVGYRLAAKSLGAKFKTGFLIDSNGGGWCMDPAGVLIDARTGGGAAKGIDFSTVTFTGNSLDMPKFKVKGNGRVSINTDAQTGEAPLFIDATGEAYPLRIDGFTVATTVGAAGGASALPATPTGYLQLRSGATTYKIPLYAN